MWFLHLENTFPEVQMISKMSSATAMLVDSGDFFTGTMSVSLCGHGCPGTQRPASASQVHHHTQLNFYFYQHIRVYFSFIYSIKFLPTQYIVSYIFILANLVVINYFVALNDINS